MHFNLEENMTNMEFPKQNSASPFNKESIGKKIAEGTFSNVYEINSSDGSPSRNVVKVGKAMEKFVPPLLKKILRIEFPREKISFALVKLLGKQFQVYPDNDFIVRGLLEHLLMKEYFGYEESGPKNYSQENREWVAKSLEDRSSQFFKEIACVVGASSMNEVAKIFRKYENYNFLPKEQTEVGHPPGIDQAEIKKLRSIGKRVPVVHYIIQEKISGPGVSVLSKTKEEDLVEHPEIVEKLITFLILIKKMYLDNGKLIDTRPEEMARHPFEWFQETDNILVDKETEDVSFVDTRLLWDKKSCIGEKGVNLIKHLGIRSIDRALKKYIGMLNSSK